MEYFDLVDQHPEFFKHKGSSREGEIEIIEDRERISALEKETGCDVGLIHKSRWGWMWINEACRFPNGKETVFGRIVLRKGLEKERCGVCVMPILPDGRVVLICNFRHPTRSWEIELPRGLLNANETIEEAARRETLEETGYSVEALKILGEIPPDSGMSSLIVPIFAAKVLERKTPENDDFEAIDDVLLLTIDEIKKAFHEGFYTCEIKGEKRLVPFRDPFLAYAVLQYDFLSE